MAKHVNKEQKRLHIAAMLGMIFGRVTIYAKANPEWTSEQIEAEANKHLEEDDLAMWDFTSEWMKKAKAE